MVYNSLFQCSVKLSKLVEGKDIPQKVVERYIVDALSYTEAEAKIIKEISPFYPTMEVGTIIKKKYTEIFLSDDDSADTYFDVKIDIVTYDEKKDKEKKSRILYLVQASDFDNAISLFKEKMKGSMCDFTMAGCNKTSILDVFLG